MFRLMTCFVYFTVTLTVSHLYFFKVSIELIALNLSSRYLIHPKDCCRLSLSVI